MSAVRAVVAEMTDALNLGALWNPEAFDSKDAILRWRDQLAAYLVSCVNAQQEQEQKKDLATRVDEQTVIPPERATAASNEAAPTVVWVAEQGAYSSRGIIGVYATAEVAMAEHPVNDKPRNQIRTGGWQQDERGAWDNGLDWDDGISVEPWPVLPAPLPRDGSET